MPWKLETLLGPCQRLGDAIDDSLGGVSWYLSLEDSGQWWCLDERNPLYSPLPVPQASKRWTSAVAAQLQAAAPTTTAQRVPRCT
jgi:hypothetical protein